MGGIAALAREIGHTVTGQDRAAWPPMSTQLESLGIAVHSGYDSAPLEEKTPDLVIVGNAVSRGTPALEYVLDRGLPYISGPQWLAENVLASRWVVAVAGTHGKTTTTSLLAHILEDCGLEPGFLIGGVPTNFGCSARLGKAPFFVIEADEYDTAFSDKRSKFVHYHPRTLVLNNLEFDHADIFADLAAIETQFHHLVRTVPGNGLIIYPSDQAALNRVLERGCWTPSLPVGPGTTCHVSEPKTHTLSISVDQQQLSTQWPMRGAHNAQNALVAVLAARHAGVPLSHAVDSLSRFQGVSRRQTLITERGGIRIYDDFAHHPTAIRETLAALTPTEGGRQVVALELRSNSMRAGAHAKDLATALERADVIHLHRPADLPFDAETHLAAVADRLYCHSDTDTLQTAVIDDARPGDTIILMSNGAFGGLPQSIGSALTEKLT